LKKRVAFLGTLLGGVAAAALIIGLATAPSAAPSANVGATTELHAGSPDSALFHRGKAEVYMIYFMWFRYN
jgi:hypothetical protein